jgi:hypothetical protein
MYTMWLPQSYAKIFDRAWDAPEGKPDRQVYEPIIEQFQASRRFKREVSRTTPKLMREPSEELKAARRACRARVDFYDERFVLNAASAPPEPWALTPGEIDGGETRGNNRTLWDRLKAKLSAK